MLFTTSCSVPYVKLKMKHLMETLEGGKNSDILIVRITFSFIFLAAKNLRRESESQLLQLYLPVF